MAFRRKSPGWGSVAAALGAAAVLGLSAGPASAQQSDPMDDLLEKLKNKGVLSDDEYQALKKAREEEQIELRNERRRQAQKAAQDAAKEGRKEAAAKKTKFDVSPGSGACSCSGTCGCATRAGGDFHFPPPCERDARRLHGGDLDRWRYAFRIGIRGDLVEDWFYGLRLDTSTNPAPSWVTFGNNVSGTAEG